MECPGESFCCRPGTTCSRDAALNAVCLDKTGDRTVTVTVKTINASQTPEGNNIIYVNNTNVVRVSAALPQVAATSGLMVTVAFLSAFLV